MRITVLDAATLGADLDLSPLSEVGECTVYQTSTAEEAVQRLKETEIVVLNKVRLTREVLASAEQLKLICIAATGYDNIDVMYCREKGIAVCNVVGYSTDSVAQLTIAMALFLVNHLPEYTDAVRSGRYTSSGVANLLTPVYHEISGKTWGIVGLGNIGKQVARIAEALGCRVVAHKRSPDLAYRCVSLESLLGMSDIVSLHTPLSRSTRGMIGEREIALMKPGAILINVARGAVTDEAAVASAIRSGKLGGIGVDVYSEEPFPESHPFYAIRNFPNVCLTPHLAWGSYEARVRCLNEIAENIRAFIRGEKHNRVDLAD